MNGTTQFAWDNCLCIPRQLRHLRDKHYRNCLDSGSSFVSRTNTNTCLRQRLNIKTPSCCVFSCMALFFHASYGFRAWRRRVIQGVPEPSLARAPPHGRRRGGASWRQHGGEPGNHAHGIACGQNGKPQEDAGEKKQGGETK